MKKHYTFETIGMSKDITIAIAQRTKVTRYGMEVSPNTTYQHRYHVGLVSVYVSRRQKARKEGVKQMGGKQNIGNGEVMEKLTALGVITGLVALGFADSIK